MNGLLIRRTHPYVSVYLLPVSASLTQEGAIALHLAVERYDPARGVRFFTYADWSLRAAFEKAVSFCFFRRRFGTCGQSKRNACPLSHNSSGP